MSSNLIVAEDKSSWLTSRFAAIAAERTAPSMLDIGCGDGKRLAQASEAGVQPFGMEPDAAALGTARQQCPGAYVVAAIEEIPPHRFDLILLSPPLGSASELYEIFYALAAKDAFGPETTVIATETEAHPAAALVALFRHLRFGVPVLADAPDGRRYEVSGSDFALFMQERYVPGTWSEIAAYEHMPRYAYARGLAAGARILDFGCGSGYGSALLADVAKSVIALDISEDALAYARDTHQHPRLTFQHDDQLGASLLDDSFDLIICFEVIEHLDALTQTKLLTELRRLLAPGGRLLISTPNPQITALYGENPYHLQELTEAEFETLLRAHFPHVDMLEQSIHTSVFLHPRGATGACEVRNDVPRMEGERKPAIYVGICSAQQLQTAPSVVYPDRAFDYIHMRTEALHRRNQHLIERYDLVQARAAIVRLEREVPELHGDRLRLEHEVSKLQGECLRLESKLTNSQSESQSKNQQLAQAAKRLAAIEASTSWRIIQRSAPLLRTMRLALRPFLRVARRVVARAGHPPTVPPPVSASFSAPRDLRYETSLDPKWDAVRNAFTLQPDENFRQLEKSGGVIPPYVVRPIIPVNPAVPRPKILHVIPNVYIGGSTQLVIDLVQHLSAFFEQEVMTSALWPGGAHDGLIVHHVPTPSPAQMAEVIDKVRPDLVHVHYWGLIDEPWYRAVAAAMDGRPIPAIQNINTPIEPLIDKMFSHHIFVSDYVRKTFGGGVTGSLPSSVIYPGIDLELFGTSTPAIDRDNAIGMVYRLEGDKLTEDAIDVFIEIVRRRPRTKAYIIGGGSFLQPYLERTERAGVRANFHFTGYVPYETLPQWYDKFAVFVAPVWKESFGQVAPFAMRKRMAVAGYAIGALPEIVGSRETLGTTVEETAAIVTALLDDRSKLHELGHRNHARATELFAVETMVSRYREVYNSLLTGR